jgi:hypothetical protein
VFSESSQCSDGKAKVRVYVDHNSIYWLRFKIGEYGRKLLCFQCELWKREKLCVSEFSAVTANKEKKNNSECE